MDSKGNAYVTGYTDSADFPLAHPLASNGGLKGGIDAFVAKIGTSGFEDREADEGR